MPWLDLEEDIAEELGGIVADARYWAGEGLTLLKSARVGMSRRRCESAPSKYAARVAKGLCPCGAARDTAKLRCARCREKRRTNRAPKLGVTYTLTDAGNPKPLSRYQTRLARGLCPSCGKARDTTTVRCARCASAAASSARRKYERKVA